MSQADSTLAAAPLVLDELNRCNDRRFVEALGGVFEHSPWVAQAARAQRPFADLDTLHDAMIDAVRALAPEQQVEFLRRHPELAGKEAQAGTMTEHSTTEQAGLNALSHDEVAQLRALNAAYAARHGFPFVIAVLTNTRAQIFAALHQRIANDTEHERAAALGQIAIITRLRLQRLFEAD
ncbi:2-oxo-4-hydroxy-4-carboxy-5-ureidoimidazoline decarboxylase [Variovorax sp. LARHSF232]